MIKQKIKKTQLLVTGLLGGVLISACGVRNNTQVRNPSLFSDAARSAPSITLREDRRSALTCLIEDDLALIAILYKIGGKSKSVTRKKLVEKMPDPLKKSAKSVVNSIYRNRSIQKRTSTREINTFLNRNFSQCLTQNGLDPFRSRMIRCRQFLNVITNINRRKRQGWSIARTRRKFAKALDSVNFKDSIITDIYNLQGPFYRFRFRVIASCASNVRK